MSRSIQTSQVYCSSRDQTRFRRFPSAAGPQQQGALFVNHETGLLLLVQSITADACLPNQFAYKWCGMLCTAALPQQRARSVCLHGSGPRLASLQCIVQAPRQDRSLSPIPITLQGCSYCASCCHWPSTASFQSVTLLEASDTESRLPLTDQLSRQTACWKSCSSVESQPPAGGCVWPGGL